MILKKLNPITNGTRHQINLKKNLLSKKNSIVKNLIKNLKLNYGRSSFTGHITVRHKGGGCKKKTHVLTDQTQYKALTICHLYSSFHNSFISLNFNFETNSFFKTTSTENIFPGSFIVCKKDIKDFFIGYRTKLKHFSVGSIIHSISYNNAILFACSAGVFCQIVEKTTKCKIRLPSGKIIHISNECFATLGVVSNSKFKSIVIGKAGRNRLKGIRPSVRGIAMNPVDHPHGGRSNGGRPSVTPWGIPTKGKPTVKKKNYE
jgi:large subunit ribosomal protein L2